VIGGATVNVTGAPASFSSSDWGVGPRKWAFDYYLSSTWFLNVNYILAQSAEYKFKYSSPFL
jgi:hypothetical protein